MAAKKKTEINQSPSVGDAVRWGPLGARVKTEVGEFSMTKQSFKDETDINKIMKKFKTTGVMTNVNNKTPTYGDFDPSIDLMEATQRVKAAWSSFNALPADVRAMADNDPIKLAAMLADEDDCYRLQEAGMELGLAPREAGESSPTPASSGGEVPPRDASEEAVSKG